MAKRLFAKQQLDRIDPKCFTRRENVRQQSEDLKPEDLPELEAERHTKSRSRGSGE